MRLARLGLGAVVIAVLAGCASKRLPTQPMCATTVSPADSAGISPEALEAYTGNGMNSIHALSPIVRQDLFVLMLRGHLLQGVHSGASARRLLAIGSARFRPDCTDLRARVSPQRWAFADSATGGEFTCFDSTLTLEGALRSDPRLAKDALNEPEDVDAHMAWFSATGDRRPVEKLVRNLSRNDKACQCISWALRSVSREDTLMRRYVREEALKYPGDPLLRDFVSP